MKKLLLCSTLIISLFLVGCNDTTDNNNNNNNNISKPNSNQTSQNTDTGIVTSESTDFSKTAGFKVNLSNSLKDVKYDSVFLINNSIVQLDLTFPDKSIGTLLVDSNNSSYLLDGDDVIFIDNVKVTIQTGADGIISYEWQKDNTSYVFSTKANIKDSQTLKNLVADAKLEKTK